MSLAEDKEEDTSDISSSSSDSSEQSDNDDLKSTDNEKPPPTKKKRSRDKRGTKVHEHVPSSSRDPYEGLHRQMTSEANQLKKLKEQYGEWKKGRWTKAEIDMLLSNITKYCEQHGIKNVKEFLVNEDKKEKSDFYTIVAWGIKRPLFLVYRQIWRIFHPASNVGRYSTDETDEVIRLHNLHGNNWAQIGEMLDRSGQSVRDKFRSSMDRSVGGWNEEEVERLITAVKEANESGFSWQLIAQQVKTRNAVQCLRKWHHQMSWKNPGEKLTKWSRDDDVRLMQELKQSTATDEDEVDWKKMTESDWPAARSGSYLRSRWALIRRQSCNYEIRSFKANVNHVHKIITESYRTKPS